MGVELIVSSATKKTLVQSNARKQRVTGTIAQTIVLPVATNLELGIEYVVFNSSTAVVSVKDSTETVTMVVPAASVERFTLVDKTGNGTWIMG